MQKILLLQLNRLGDLIQTVPLLKRLRGEYPAAEITLICLKGVDAIIRDCGYFDRMVALPNGDVDALAEPDRRQAFPNLAPFDGHPEFREEYDLLINVTSDLGSAILNEKIAATRKLGRIHTFEGELRLLGSWSKYLFAMVTNRIDNLFNPTGISILIVSPIVGVIIAGILFAIFNAAMGGEASFKQVFAVYAHAGAVSALSAMFSGIVNYFRGGMTSVANLGALLPMLPENSFAGRLLGMVDIFLIWYIIVLAIGLAVLYRRRTQPIAISLLSVYAVIAIVVALIKSRVGGA